MHEQTVEAIIVDGPVQPIAAAVGDPRKTLKAPFDCVVKRRLVYHGNVDIKATNEHLPGRENHQYINRGLLR
jgi:hypothetical protein